MNRLEILPAGATPWQIGVRAARANMVPGFVLPNQVPGWTFWTPCLLALYSLPTALQMPMAALLGCFWALMCPQIALRTPASS